MKVVYAELCIKYLNIAPLTVYSSRLNAVLFCIPILTQEQDKRSVAVIKSAQRSLLKNVDIFIFVTSIIDVSFLV